MGTTSKQYKKLCDGVLYCDDSKNVPNKININGKEYELFLDHFYLDRPLDDLTEETVTVICKLREEIEEWKDEDKANNLVSRLFAEIIMSVKPRTVFEVGPGIYPLFKSINESFEYIQGELDMRVVEENTKNGYHIYHFDSVATLPIPDGSMDIILGIFVFQFHFSDNQIKEIGRILNLEGCLLINVYHRNDVERRNLLDKFKTQNLIVNIYPDPDELCREHQYWLISKSEKLSDICLKTTTFLK